MSLNVLKTRRREEKKEREKKRRKQERKQKKPHIEYIHVHTSDPLDHCHCLCKSWVKLEHFEPAKLVTFAFSMKKHRPMKYCLDTDSIWVLAPPGHTKVMLLRASRSRAPPGQSRWGYAPPSLSFSRPSGPFSRPSGPITVVLSNRAVALQSLKHSPGCSGMALCAWRCGRQAMPDGVRIGRPGWGGRDASIIKYRYCNRWQTNKQSL